MSDIKAIVYDTCGKRDEIVSSLERAGIGLISGEGEEALLAADFLVLSTADARELDEKEVSQAWNFYLDELRWKRKESGEIIIIDCSDISFSPSRLAYGLKKCHRFRLAQIDEATRYMKGGKQSKPSAVSSAPAFSYKPSDYSKPAGYDRPEPKEEKPHESGACKESHVFGEEARKKEKPQSQKKAEETAAEKARQEELRKALEERTTPVVKSEKAMEIIEEAKRRLEEKRKEQESDPRLNPVFDGEELERHKKVLEKERIRNLRNESYNPFEDYPDFLKEKKTKNQSQSKNIGITIIIAAVILIVFMIITSTIGMCSIEVDPFSVGATALTREEVSHSISCVAETTFKMLL